MEEMISMALGQGLGYALFVWLLIYVLKTQEKRDLKSEERENKYQDIIRTLTDKFNIVEVVKKDVEEIKDCIFKK